MARGPPCLQRQTLGKLQEVAAIIAIDSNIGMTVKAIVLDDGFWQSITEILHVPVPIIKLLRLLDSNKPVIGKVAVLRLMA